MNEDATPLFPSADRARTARAAHARRRRYTWAAFLAAIAIEILIALAAFQSIQSLGGQAQSVDHTREVLIEIEELLSLTSTARTAWWSYLSGGASRYVQEFASTRDAIASKTRLLKGLIADNPPQQQRLDALAQAEARDLDAMGRSIALKQSGALDNAPDVLSEVTGMRLSTTALEGIAREMKEEEKSLLAARTSQSSERARQTIALIIFGTLTSLAVLVFTFALLRRETVQRASAEAALAGSEERFRSLAQSAVDAIVSTDSTGRIVFWNSGAEKIFGYSEEEIRDQPLTVLVPERHRERVGSGLLQFLAQGKQPDDPDMVEQVALRKDGREFPSELSFARWEAQGEVFFTAVLRDLTARRQAEEELRRSEESFRLIVENVVDYALIMLDPQGHIVSWNTGAERNTGYRAEEVLGKHFSLLYLAEDIEYGKPDYELRVAASEGRCEDEGWRVRKNGTTYWANVVVTPVRDGSGSLLGFAKVTRDLTERRRADEAIRKLNEDLQRRTGDLTAVNADLESFSYSVAHDLRAPVRHILGYSGILLDEYGAQLDEAARGYLSKVQESAQRMGQLVDDLLKLAHVGRQVPDLQLTSLRDLVDDVVRELEPEYAGRDIAWQIGELPQVWCDPALLKQALTNIISNAVKYTRPRAHATIQVGSLTAEHEPVIFVRDNGVGFEMKYVNKLFGVFQRLHNVQEFEGTGVGLAIAERIVRSHGGRIWAEAAPDRGATIFFSIGSQAR